jgi:hypothetical protein
MWDFLIFLVSFHFNIPQFVKSILKLGIMDESTAVLVFAQKCFAAGALSRPPTALKDFSDGRILIEMCHNIAPGFGFDPESLGEAEPTPNWALSLSNLKKLVRKLDAFFKQELGKEIANLQALDLDAIAKSSDVDEILNLVELVIGAAVMSTEKGRFVTAIFSLGDAGTQNTLKALIEHAMSRLVDFDPVSSGEKESGDTAAANAMI